MVQPNRVLAFKDDFTVSSEEEVFLRPNQIVQFTEKLPDGLRDIADSGMAINLHLSSKYAQAGLDLLGGLTVEDGRLNGKIINVGPRTFSIPAKHPLPIGFLYLRSPYESDERRIKNILDAFTKVNDKNQGIERFGNRLFIETNGILTYADGVGNDDVIDLSTLPRGTQRPQLHKVLNISEIDPSKLKDGTYRDTYYALTQTRCPIHYPPGMGVVIVGGAFIHADGRIDELDHGNSVVGQSRNHDPGSPDPEHTLIGELFAPDHAIAQQLTDKVRVGLVCEPVDLIWIDKINSSNH